MGKHRKVEILIKTETPLDVATITQTEISNHPTVVELRVRADMSDGLMRLSEPEINLFKGNLENHEGPTGMSIITSNAYLIGKDINGFKEHIKRSVLGVLSEHDAQDNGSCDLNALAIRAVSAFNSALYELAIDYTTSIMNGKSFAEHLEEECTQEGIKLLAFDLSSHVKSIDIVSEVSIVDEVTRDLITNRTKQNLLPIYEAEAGIRKKKEQA